MKKNKYNMGKVDIDKLDKLVDEGWLLSRDHDCLPLRIYNYSHQCQFKKHWTDETMLCRGIVVKKDSGKIISRPFRKFFNNREFEDFTDINKPFRIEEKLDGSMFVVSMHDKEFMFSSRGSFNSDQAIEGREIFYNNKYDRHIVGSDPMYNLFDNKHTFVFEVIYPENKIVVDYGEEKKLILLGVINNITGEEIDIFNSDYGFADIFNLPNLYSDMSMKTKNFEGYVIRYDDGHRIKIKLEEYVRLHRILSGVNDKWIWECAKNNDNIEDAITGVPDEIYKEVTKKYYDFQSLYKRAEKLCKESYAESKKHCETRKDYADFFKGSLAGEGSLVSTLFAMLDGKDYSDILWKFLKPQNNS